MFRKKKEVPVWPLEGEYQRLCALMCRTDLIWDGAEYDKTLKRIAYLQDLRQKFLDGSKEPEKKKADPNNKLAAGVTVAAASAPYVIEALGHTANHLKGRVQLPNPWK